MKAGCPPNNSEEIDKTQVYRALEELNHQEPVPSTSYHSTETEEDHEEHIDERWLVSYADMMTLLFGLFVMLFSMSTIDASKFEKIKDSANKQFNSADANFKPLPPSAQQELQREVEEAKAEIERLKLAIAEREQRNRDIASTAAQGAESETLLSTQISDLKAKVAELETENNSKAGLIESLSKGDPKLHELQQELLKLKEVSSENLRLKKDLKDKERQVASLQETKQPQPDPKIWELEKSGLEKQIQGLEKKVDELKAAGSSNQGFLAVIIKWPTADHDVDLVIEDPEHKTFNFKKRQHSGHPGNFSMDTRRGPGTEVWQSDKIIPGTYKASYIFYNQYSNQEPAKVSATILTPKGSIELPPVELTFDKKKRTTVTFQVDQNGKVQIKGRN